MVEPLDRPILSYIHARFIILDENVDVATAVREMHSQKSEIVIVTKDGKSLGIVTDSDILDKVVMKGEDSDQILLRVHSIFPSCNLISKWNC